MRDKWMPPEWLAYPEIPQFSIGWRMGYGEDYLIRLSDWLEGLSEAEKAEYERLFPRPVFWDSLEEDGEEIDAALFYEGKHDYFLRYWRPHGLPAYDRAALEADAAAGKELEFLHFWGHYSKDGSIGPTCLSQWWMSDFKVEGELFHCMEQYMMAEKARLFGDREIREQIMCAATPAKMKALGRKVRNFDQGVWDKCKYTIVLTGNFQKFLQRPDMKDFLLRTGDKILVEASSFDHVWGIGLAASQADARTPSAWRGTNFLGFALMEARAELRRVCANEDKLDWGAVKTT